jgi:uncharacterized membrane protein (DUF485 family)
MSLDTFVKIFRRPCQFREFLDQTWMIARVSLIPTLLVAIPFTVLVAFTLNILLREIGAADLSGAGTAFGSITQLGPVVTVLVVAGAGATASCADLGARTIREEIDAMRVLGIDPIQRLVVPRVLASTFVAAAVTGLFTWLAFDSNRHMEAAADRQQRIVDTATQAVMNMFSYNQNSIDESVNRFVNGTSGPLRDMMSQPGRHQRRSDGGEDRRGRAECGGAGVCAGDRDRSRRGEFAVAPYRLRVIVHEADNGRMSAYDLKYPDGGN